MSLVVDIKKNYGKFKLRVQFEAETGVSGLLGASGCGKSLTLKAIAGIERPDSGRILLNGRTLFDSALGIDLLPQERGTGYLFQSYALFPNMTAAQNIGVGVRNRSRRKHVTAELLRAFRLEDVAQKYPRQLSGGQQQRVALARILAGGPDVLLLDEPFSALDSHLKGNVYRELQNVLERFSGVTILVTHDREEVLTFCDEVCVLTHGKSQSMQSVQDLFAAPDTVAACQLTGCENIVPARIHENGCINVPDWGTELRCRKPLSDEVTAVGIKGQDFILVDGPGENRLYCRVLSEVKSGFSVKVTGEIPGYGSILYAELERSRWPYLEQPEGIWLQVRPEYIMPLMDC